MPRSNWIVSRDEGSRKEVLEAATLGSQQVRRCSSPYSYEAWHSLPVSSSVASPGELHDGMAASL